MKATYIFVVLAMAISSLAATTPVQNNRVQGGNNRFGGSGGQARGGQNGQQNKGSNNTKNNNNNGKNANNNSNTNSSNSKGAATGGAATGAAGGAAASGANTGSVRTSNGSNQNQASNSTGSAASGASSNSADAQTSDTLDPAVIAKGFANNGQDVPTAGQVASLTSTNNFINFCLTVPNLPLTNGQQITTGSCNPAPMGIIPSTDNMPSAKFAFPKNGDTIQENTAFTITMNIANMQTGAFVNADENYFAAPQQTNAQGQIIGHSHVVVEPLSALDQTTPLDPRKFAFFKGLNGAAVNGALTADVTAGLPAGFYKLSSINTAANHQPVLVPIAQHGSLDDAVYFTVTASGQAASNSTAAAGAGGAGTAAGGAAAGSAGGATAGAAAGKGAASNNNGAAKGAAQGNNNGNNNQASNNNNGKNQASNNNGKNQASSSNNGKAQANNNGGNSGEQRTVNKNQPQQQRGGRRRIARQL